MVLLYVDFRVCFLGGCLLALRLAVFMHLRLPCCSSVYRPVVAADLIVNVLGASGISVGLGVGVVVAAVVW